ncbi:MAG: primosomal protein N' [Bdellovibrionales bacterium]|nr:primosomal protein N' [Bdellovibrionales bacterium]
MKPSDIEFAAKVLISGVPKPLSYSLGPAHQHVQPGDEVTVELGRRLTTGWVIEKLPLEKAVQSAQKVETSPVDQLQLLHVTPQQRLKQVTASAPAFQAEQLPLFQWMAEYYGVSLLEVLETAVPKRAHTKTVVCVRAADDVAVRLQEEPDLLATLSRRAPVQATLLECVLAADAPLQLAELKGFSKNPLGPLKALAARGLLVLDRVSQSALIGMENEQQERVYHGRTPNELTPRQAEVLAQINTALDAGQFSPFLLFGVTGSGKTEVYLRAIQRVLAEGGAALVILPEISLTPQFVDQFQARLNTPIALLHSQVGPGARWEAWNSLLQGEVRVALGARSSVFAPLKNLRLVIVDEEHESSYKQSEGFRYHARDVAVMRAKFSECPVLLGSATPSFESLVNVQRKRYGLLELPERATSRPVPKPELIDLTKIKRKEMPSPTVSPPLFEAIRETLEAKGQVVILYNKRGFASYLQCESCNEVISCPDCSLPLTYHKARHILLCHYCGISQEPPEACPLCRDPRTARVETDEHGAPLETPGTIASVGRLEHRGAGTEKVVDELASLFPEATIIRMDRDTVGTKGAYRRILGSMRSGEADILVGTQMIAKGHDLPGVTLVGVIDADVGLHIPDFRSSEKIYQLITQASGRAGRGTEAGRVLVQTREPHHPTLVATVTGRFKAFARYELDYRKKLGYPPLGRLLRLIVSSPSSAEARTAAAVTRDVLANAIELQQSQDGERGRTLLLGPAPAPYERLRGRYRWHLLVKSPSAKTLSELARMLNQWRLQLTQFQDVRVAVDVDPVDML